MAGSPSADGFSPCGSSRFGCSFTAFLKRLEGAQGRCRSFLRSSAPRRGGGCAAATGEARNSAKHCPAGRPAPTLPSAFRRYRVPGRALHCGGCAAAANAAAAVERPLRSRFPLLRFLRQQSLQLFQQRTVFLLPWVGSLRRLVAYPIPPAYCFSQRFGDG